jgi:hypothetical protein
MNFPLSACIDRLFVCFSLLIFSSGVCTDFSFALCIIYHTTAGVSLVVNISKKIHHSSSMHESRNLRYKTVLKEHMC